MVIGRNYIDGYTIDFGYHKDSIDVIDVSDARMRLVGYTADSLVITLHQNDNRGTFAGEKNVDGFWNKQKGGKIDHETIRLADYKASIFIPTSAYL